MKAPIPFGKYTLLERINVGGMAEVFRAKAFGVEGFERLVAVKRILPAIAEDKEFIRMFIDEAKLAVQLNHANIAQIFDLGVVDNSHYIALEHVHGRDLRAIFDRCRADHEPMSVAQACFILMKVCEGLDYAHNKRDQGGRELGLVHRDVSPQNILVSFEGEIKLVDFGIAKAVGQQSSKTQAGILKGKFGYMSPEQVRGNNIDRRSDVFSCGIVLYELLTNERLFVGETDFATLEKVRNVEILPPTTYNRKIPDELERIALKALTLNPDDRYQNAIDLHDELQAFVYTSGEFFSRKDLAGWMKKTFAKEIAEEGARLEEYRQVVAPADSSAHGVRASTTQPPPLPSRPHAGTKPPPPPPSRRMTTPSVLYDEQKTAIDRPAPQVPGQGARVDDTNPDAAPTLAVAVAAGSGKKRGNGLDWDDEELETQIYDSPEQNPAARRPGRASERPPTRGGHTAARAQRASGTPAVGAPRDELPVLSAAVPDAPTLLAMDGGLATPGELPSTRGRTTRPPLPTGADVPFAVATGRPGRASGGPVKIDPAAGLAASTTASAFGGAVIASRRGGAANASQRWQWVALAGAALLVLAVFLVWRANRAQEQAAAATSGFDLYITPSTDGVKWKLDGVEQPPVVQGAEVRKLRVGTHQIAIEAPSGYMHHSQDVEVVAGEIGKVNVVLRPAAVVMTFSSVPPGASIGLLVDGATVDLGAAPAQKELDPKKQYQVTAALEGHVSATQPVVFGNELTQSMQLTLAPAERDPGPSTALTRPDPSTPEVVGRPVGKPSVAVRPPTVEPSTPVKPTSIPTPTPTPVKPTPAAPISTLAEDGALSLGAKPPCDIYINGKNTGLKTPQREMKLPPGTHKVTLINNDFLIRDSFTVTIVSGKTERVVKDYADKIAP